MTDFRKVYGLPARYFLSLGRMVPKKNLATLVAAYAKFCDGWRVTCDERETADGGQAAATKTSHSLPVTRHPLPALVFVGSGEEEEALREQARLLGLEVVERGGAMGEVAGGGWRVAGEGKEEHGRDVHAPWAEMGDGRVLRKAEKLKDGKAERGEMGDGRGTESRDQLPVTRHEENCGAVFFYGFRQIEENPVFYALAEAFVLPSLYEEWGLVVNEAMACSLPVIVSRTAGCAEDLVPASGPVACGVWRVAGEKSENCKLKTENSLEQRSNGFVFDPEDVEALATALARVAEGVRRGEREAEVAKPRETEDGIWEMGRRSREIVERFSCENFAKQALRAAKAAGR